MSEENGPWYYKKEGGSAYHWHEHPTCHINQYPKDRENWGIATSKSEIPESSRSDQCNRCKELG